jgi:hypothetical protein
MATRSGALDIEGSSPPPRSWHAAVAINDNRRVLVHGGMSADIPAPAGSPPNTAEQKGKTLDDAWVYVSMLVSAREDFCIFAGVPARLSACVVSAFYFQI